MKQEMYGRYHRFQISSRIVLFAATIAVWSWIGVTVWADAHQQGYGRHYQVTH